MRGEVSLVVVRVVVVWVVVVCGIHLQRAVLVVCPLPAMPASSLTLMPACMPRPVCLPVCLPVSSTLLLSLLPACQWGR